MALTQRQLAEVAREALDAVRAYEELERATREVLARRDLCAESKVALLRYVLEEQPQVGAAKAASALEHIARTSARNEKRAASARRLRNEAKERENG